MPRESACHFDPASVGPAKERAIEFLDQHGLVVTPATFAVAYDYALHRNGELRKDIDRELLRGRCLDLDLITEIFNRYFLREADDALAPQLKDLQRVLFQVLEGVSQAGHDMGEYGDVLGGHLETLATDPDLRQIRLIARELAAATEQALAGNRRLQLHMTKAEAEAQEMRLELVRLREQAETDPLTRLPNRRVLNARLTELAEEAGRSGAPLAFVLLDIDHFKQVNDRFGHPIGDEVIRRVAAVVRGCVRQVDTPARYGGEEFALVLPGLDREAALQVAEAIRSRVEHMVLMRRASRTRLPGVTVSAGVALWAPADSPAALVERADQALYLAKRNGRNRVQAEGDSDETLEDRRA